VGAGGVVGVAGTGVADGAGVAVGASVAEAGNVGGTSVGGAPGDAVPARATGLTVGVPSTVTLPARGRVKKKKATAMTMIRTPNARATQGQRFDGSPGSGRSATGGTMLMQLPVYSAQSGPAI
jgi:hypothetical protein